MRLPYLTTLVNSDSGLQEVHALTMNNDNIWNHLRDKISGHVYEGNFYIGFTEVENTLQGGYHHSMGWSPGLDEKT